MFIIFDTETTGLPGNYNAPVSDSDNWPRVVQLAWQLHDDSGKLLGAQNYIVKPEGFDIPYNSTKIHGITTERAIADGIPLEEVLAIFGEDLAKSKYAVGHNIEFDVNIMGAEYFRKSVDTGLMEMQQLDTKHFGTDFCQIPGGRGGKFKWPTLTELHQKLFGEGFGDAHDAAYDVDATARCFFGLITHNALPVEEILNPSAVVYEAPKLDAANFAHEEEKEAHGADTTVDKGIAAALAEEDFAHLHCHTQFSILQSTTDIKALVGTAKSLGMPAIAMSDHGNMMGIFHFVREALKQGVTPIVGCEFNMCKDHLNKSVKDNGYQTVVLAKNRNGYHNLAKLASIAYTAGSYYVPRIDRDLLLKHKKDLFVFTGGIWGEVPSLLLNVGEKQAEEAFVWYKEHFGKDFYAELNRHGLEEEEIINATLLKFCEKHDVKYIAANNNYYPKKENAKAHDVLLCVKDAENVSKPKKYLGKKGREFRFGFPNDEFYIKSKLEMAQLFSDLPEAYRNTQEILAQIEEFELERSVLLPKFPIPKEFEDAEDLKDDGTRGENNFLRHITYVGAHKRYGEVLDEATIERLDFELATIAKTGYPGYFLIVQDFTTKARELGVSVGPGRGSAAGSAVAYCVGITNVDPIKYDLLFERFLNPDRVSMPDIDIDFDDEGRQKVIDYVIETYGANQVAQIITYGTMAAKSSIRDTARVMELPLHESDRIAKLVPDFIKLKKIFSLDDTALSEKLKNNQEDIQRAKELKNIADSIGAEADVLNQARVLEGSVRNTGIHACGVIITPADITNYVPVATAKDSDMWCTQFDNSVAEDAGLLKMDFLGLKTLTLIKDACAIVKQRHGVVLDPDAFPLDDVKTYELFQRGETVGIFQYESAGMQKYMRELKPTVFADLIAMNALYRPGPLEYIPSFIRRKHGTEPVTYDVEACKEYLEETYGITVYQEQVMLLSQKLAGFTKGEADTLRKAMGKKKIDLLEKMKPQFLNQGAERGHDKVKLDKIWKDWEAFASYAFNKSHSTCYAWIAYQTAYLKAHYPAEYMASVLSNNMSDIKQVTFFMEECKRMGVPVLGPDVSESNHKFTVNEQGQVRFGMGAIKGVGKNAIANILEVRAEGGKFDSIFDFVSRVDLRSANKRTMESFANGGAFDEFGIARAAFFTEDNRGSTFLETVVKFGHAQKEEDGTMQQSLFGGDTAVEVPMPIVPKVAEFGTLERLGREKDVIGIYISGHPLDDFKLELSQLATLNGYEMTRNPNDHKGKDITLIGIANEVAHRTTKNGKPFGILSLEGYDDADKFYLFGDDYTMNRHNLIEGLFLMVKGKIQEKKWGKKGEAPEYEFKVGDISLLQDARENLKGKMEISVALQDITETLIEDFKALVERNEGGNRVTFKILDGKGKLALQSKSFKVSLENDFINGIERIQEFDYKICQ